MSQGVARAAEKLGPAAVNVYEDNYPAYGYMSHHLRNVPSAIHWAMDSRDPFNSSHDYLLLGAVPSIANYFGLPGGDISLPQGGADFAGTKVSYERAEHSAVWCQNHQSLKNSLPICEYASMPLSQSWLFSF